MSLKVLSIETALNIAKQSDTRNVEGEKLMDDYGVGTKSGGGRIFTRSDLAKLPPGRAPEEAKLYALVKALTPEQRYELMALLWLGRGDQDGSFTSMVEYAKQNSDAGDIDYITDKGPLGDYIRSGLRELGL